MAGCGAGGEKSERDMTRWFVGVKHDGRREVFAESSGTDPIAELRAVTDKIEPMPEARIVAALETCSAENMRQMGGPKSQHVRAAKVGDSREKLNEEHLAVFREKYADMIRALGYEVR